jgi:hypothetical protein
MTQKVIANTVHSVVGDVESSTDVVDFISRLLAEHLQCYDLAGKPRSELFVTNAHPNISVFNSLSTHSLLSVLEKHGNAVPLGAELASALFLANGNDKVYQAFQHLEELEILPKDNLIMYFANWCNGEFGSIFSSGKFQQFWPPTQKPFPGLVVIGNNLVMRDIMISVNEEGQSFSKSMEVLKNIAHGVTTVVGPKVLRTVANAGCIISNENAVEAELSCNLAKQVGPYYFTPMTAAKTYTHLNCHPNHVVFVKWLLQNG